MGFTDVCERLGISYESDDAYELIDRLVEFVSWHAIDASADLAREPEAEDEGWIAGHASMSEAVIVIR